MYYVTPCSVPQSSKILASIITTRFCSLVEPRCHTFPYHLTRYHIAISVANLTGGFGSLGNVDSLL